MNLQGRDLSIDLQGDDVRLLHREMNQIGAAIDPAEAARGFFGPSTRQAVVEFQLRNALEPSGVVEERTARVINQRVDAESARSGSFVVEGLVTQNEVGGDLVRGALVQAFDVDLPSLDQNESARVPLGEAITNADGFFRIVYSLRQFARGEAVRLQRRDRVGQKDADLRFAISREGKPLTITGIMINEVRISGDVPIIFNAPSGISVKLIVAAPDTLGQSEYELLMQDIEPVIEILMPADLTQQDLAFLAGDLELAEDGKRNLAFLRAAAILSRRTELATEAFYGWARTGILDPQGEIPSLDGDTRDEIVERLLDQLATNEEGILVEHLLRAESEHIIAAQFRERANAIAHAIRSRGRIEQTVRLRLEREPTGEVLVGYAVTSFDVDAHDRDLGTDVTDPLGEFDVSYFVDATEALVERNFRFRVRGPSIAELIDVSQRIKPDLNAPVGVRITLTVIDPTLTQLRDDSQLELSADVLQILEQSAGIRTFADIRRRGGIVRVEGLRDLDPGIAHHLDALANLDLLSSNINETKLLIERRYPSVAAIAEAPRSEFVAALSADRERVSERRATELHISATAQVDMLGQIIIGLAADAARAPSSHNRSASG